MNEKVSTGNPTVDEMTGGGFPRGGVTSIFGDPRTGKTTLIQSAARAVLDSKGREQIINLEESTTRGNSESLLKNI